MECPRDQVECPKHEVSAGHLLFAYGRNVIATWL